MDTKGLTAALMGTGARCMVMDMRSLSEERRLSAAFSSASLAESKRSEVLPPTRSPSPLALGTKQLSSRLQGRLQVG